MEDCLAFSSGNAEVSKLQDRWKLVDGSRWLFYFGSGDEAASEATRALEIIRHYGLDESCFIGRPDPKFSYLLAQRTPPAGALEGEDCLRYDLDALKVKPDGENWLMTDGRSRMLLFSDVGNAHRALALVKYYGFTHQCFVGRPDPDFVYWRKDDADELATEQPITDKPITDAIERGLVAYYSFDGDFNDYSGNPYHATNMGAAWVSNRYGHENKALLFDGSNSGVRLDEGFPEVFDQSLTVSMWVYFNDDSRAILFGSYDTANNVNFEKHRRNRLRIWWNDGEVDFYTPDNAITLQKWHLVTFVRDKERGKFVIYVDGNEVANTSNTGTDVTPAGRFYVGRDSRAGSTVTDGKIDDVRVYNRALPNQEVSGLLRTT